MRDQIYIWLNNPTIMKFLIAGTAVIVVIVIARLISRSVTSRVSNVDNRYRLRKFTTLVSYVLIVLIMTVIFSNQLSGLTVAMGVAGAGIAFALQEVIASFAGWFAIMFANFYSTGDRVQLGGIKGDVIDISFLRTTLMETGEWVDGDLYNGRVVRVANSFVFKEPVFNYSGDFPFLWDEIKVPVKHGCDHKLAKEILETIANEVTGKNSAEARKSWDQMLKKFRLENAAVIPAVTLIANDNWLEFTVRYVVDFKSRRMTKSALFGRILDEFAKTEGKLAFASATFHLVEAPPIEVLVQRNEKIPVPK